MQVRTLALGSMLMIAAPALTGCAAPQRRGGPCQVIHPFVAQPSEVIIERICRVGMMRLKRSNRAFKLWGATEDEIVFLGAAADRLLEDVSANPLKPWSEHEGAAHLAFGIAPILARISLDTGVSAQGALALFTNTLGRQVRLDVTECEGVQLTDIVGATDDDFEAMLQAENESNCADSGEDAGGDIGVLGEFGSEMRSCMKALAPTLLPKDECAGNPLTNSDAPSGDAPTEASTPSGDNTTGDAGTGGSSGDAGSTEESDGDPNAGPSDADIAAKKKADAKAEAEASQAFYKAAEIVGVTAGIVTTLTPAGAVSKVALYIAAAAGGVKLVELVKNFDPGSPDCYAFSVLPTLSVPYLVTKPLGGENPEGPTLGYSMKGIPGVIEAMDYCLCETGQKSNLPALSDIGLGIGLGICPSEEDKARMDCLSAPLGPDDSPKPDCLRILRDDNATLSTSELCQLVQCDGSGLRAISSMLEECPCIQEEMLILTSMSSLCQNVRCPEGSVCVNGICEEQPFGVFPPDILRRAPGLEGLLPILPGRELPDGFVFRDLVLPIEIPVVR